MSGGVSLAHIAHGVCNPAKDAASLWWLNPTTVGQMASPQRGGKPLRPHSRHSHHLHSFHLTLSTAHGPQSLVPLLPPLPQFLSFSPQEFWQSMPTSKGTHRLLLLCISPRRPPAPGTTPPTLTPFWWTVETRWSLATLNAYHPSQSALWNDRAGAKVVPLDGAINSSQLTVANQDFPTRLPSQGQPSSPDVAPLRGNLLPDVACFNLTTLRSDLLPETDFLSSHAPPSARKAHSFTNFHKAYWEGFTAESESRFA